MRPSRQLVRISVFRLANRKPFQSIVLFIQQVFVEFLHQASTMLGSERAIGVFKGTMVCKE